MRVKRSEIQRMIERWGSPEDTAHIMDAIEKAIAHGYEYDEPEIAPVLVAVGTSLMTPIEDADKPGGRRRYATHKETVLAAEAYNRRGTVAEVAAGLRRMAPIKRLVYVYSSSLHHWADLLEGKAHGADAKDGEGRS